MGVTKVIDDLVDLQKHLTTATAGLTSLGDTYGAIMSHHLELNCISDGVEFTSKHKALTKSIAELNRKLWERTPTPLHPTMNSSGTRQPSFPNPAVIDARKTKEATLNARAKYDKMKLDLKTLTLATQSFDWNSAEDHIIQKGMKNKLKWREDHSRIANLVIEIKVEAQIHDLSDLLDEVKETEEELTRL